MAVKGFLDLYDKTVLPKARLASKPNQDDTVEEPVEGVVNWMPPEFDDTAYGSENSTEAVIDTEDVDFVNSLDLGDYDLNFADQEDRNYLFDAQLWQESRYRSDVTSHAGAQGIAQFMPKTWQEAINRGWVESGSSPFNVDSSLNAQRSYMEHLYQRPAIQGAKDETERINRLLASYNWGIGNLGKAIERARTETGDANNWIKYAPEETTNYIKRITGRVLEQKNQGIVSNYSWY